MPTPKRYQSQLKRRRIRVGGLLYLLSLTALAIAVAAGAAAAEEIEPQEATIALQAGQSYVIRGLKVSATPAVKVIANRNALILRSGSPGTLTLLGAAKGRWDIDAELADGAPAVFHVMVSAVADSSKPLEPGSKSAARPLDDEHSQTPLDAGAGPLENVSGAGSSVIAAAGAATQAGSNRAGSSARLTSSGVITPTPAPQLVPKGAPQAVPEAAPQTGQASALDASMTMPESPAVPAEPSSAARASAGAQAAPPHPRAPGVPWLTGQAALPAVRRFRTDPSATSFPDLARSGGPHAGANYLPTGVIELMANTSEIFDFPQRLRRVSIADSKIADIQVINPYQLNLIGHKQGFTTLVVWDDQGRYQERRVRVDRTGEDQVLLSVIVAELDRSKIENQGINISAALSNYGVSLVGLPGAVATPYTPTTSASGSGGPSGGSGAAGLPSGGSLIPLLLSPALTYGLAAQNASVATQTFFQYLETHNLGKVLAEPHLLANSGQQAKFLSGGEIPIVISQALNSTIVFKQYGTSIVFVPTVIGPDNIDLKVKPEVSQPDYTHGVQLFGFTVPAFVTRSADTDVRLRNGQTLIVAGLLLDTRNSTVNKVPYLGDIPYMGALFRTTGYSDNKTDLVMSVTPRIVQPLPDGAAPADPTDVGPLTPAEIRTRSLKVYDASRPRF